MQDDELLKELEQAATASVQLAGEMPSSIVGIAFGWVFEPDPNDSAGRHGLRITWRTYFDAAPGETEIEFANSCSDYLVGHLWSRIIWVEHENKVVPNSTLALSPQFKRWLYLRQPRGGAA